MMDIDGEREKGGKGMRTGQVMGEDRGSKGWKREVRRDNERGERGGGRLERRHKERQGETRRDRDGEGG